MKRSPFIAASAALALLAAVAAFPAAAQSFAPPTALLANSYYSFTSVALADVNGDGILDFIAIYPGSPASFTGGPGGVKIVLGSAAGGFTDSPNYLFWPYSNTSTGPVSLTLGDINADGRLDVITPMSSGIVLTQSSSYGTPVYGTNLIVFFGGSAGPSGYPGQYPVGYDPTAALVADFNQDGIPDVAVTNASGILSVYLGVGGGLYQGATVYHVGGNPKAIRGGDFNHDGKPDLATVNTSDGTLSILLNNGDGTFQKAKRFLVGANLRDAALADLNGDGRTDIVTLRYGEIDTFLSNGDGTFSLSKTYPASSTATALLLADFSGSGKLDVLTNDAVLLRGIGKAAGNTALNTYSGNLAVGDVNGDGKLDFVIGSQLYLNAGLASSATFP